VLLRAGQVMTLEFRLPGSNFAEAVQVTAAQPAVEVGRTVQSNTHEERTVRAVPTVGRSILDFFVLQPTLTLFGEDVTPNAHALAREFVTLDNFYVDAEVSYDGQARAPAR
jgi:hypothetical protein